MAKLLTEADGIPGYVLCCPDLYNDSFLYIGMEMYAISRYPREKFMQHGLPFMYEHTRPTDVPRLAAEQTVYMKMVKQPDFSLSSVMIQEYEFGLICPGGAIVEMASLGVILSFNSHREFQVGVGFFMRNDERRKQSIAKCRNLLCKIKDRHNMIWDHPSMLKDDIPYLMHYMEKMHHQVTLREREVLKYLANGLSSKEMSEQLGISFNTVESHRKNLLQKFEAKNSTELIKKAGKIFWLE
ncbi:MAG: helix-turn-helix transcriptional regulator [Bacteroidetes bacterium]|nr:helix-turn-helix transcriptional regulator [Bacteroidota bacterium]